MLSALAETTDKQPFLKHALRIALRNQLRENAAFKTIRQTPLSPRDAAAIADVAIAVKTPAAANFLLSHIASGRPPAETIRRAAGHIARHASATDLEHLPQIIETVFAGDLDQQLAVHKALEDGNQQRGQAPAAAFRDWGIRLAERLLNRAAPSSQPWTHRPVPGMPPTQIPWILESRPSADGDPRSPFLCSLSPGGESFTGILASPSFLLPAKLSFFLAGHDGRPDTPAQGRNRINLRLADNNKIIAHAAPPRNDIAQQITWGLSPFRNQQAYLEIIDSNDGGGWAWLAFGRLSPPLAPLPELSPQHRSRLLAAAARIIADAPESAPYQNAVSAINNPKNSPATRAQMALELSQPHSHPLAAVLAKQIADPALTENQRLNIGQQLFAPNDSLPTLIRDLLNTLPERSQQSLIRNLSINQNGAQLALRFAEEGAISATLLNDSKTKEQIRNHGPQATQQLETLLQNLPSTNTNRSEKIQQLSRNLSNRSGNREEGRRLFAQACQICHQLAGQGTLIGPHLDGMANRGLERLLEDILDPNRNLDKAFQTQTLTLANGDALTGLHRRDDGALAIFANTAGQEFSISKQSILSRKTNPKSLMPDNFIEILNEDQLSNLTTFLLSPDN